MRGARDGAPRRERALSWRVRRHAQTVCAPQRRARSPVRVAALCFFGQKQQARRRLAHSAAWRSDIAHGSDLWFRDLGIDRGGVGAVEHADVARQVHRRVRGDCAGPRTETLSARAARRKRARARERRAAAHQRTRRATARVRPGYPPPASSGVITKLTPTILTLARVAASSFGLRS